jgi:single-stranded DNA-binding protein
MDKNFLQIAGRLTGQVFTGDTKTGGKWVKFQIKTQTGKDKFDRFTCMSFSSSIVQTVSGLTDGDYITVVGSIKMNNWKNAEGVWHNDMQIMVNTIERLTGYDAPAQVEPQSQQAPVAVSSYEADPGNPLSQIPF